MIQIKELNVSFGKTEVLKDIDLEIQTGKTQVLLGSSGSGKSTLIRVLMGLVPFSRGTISFWGNELIEKSGYVIQEGGLFPHMDIRKNLIIRAEHRKWSTDRINKKLDELLSLVSLNKDILSRYPAEVSGGQRQRISLARALFCEPELLLMDEPLGALDPITRYDLQFDLKKLFTELNKTVLLVTHDLSEAFYLGDSIALLHEGKIIQTGRPNEFIHHPSTEYVKKFVGSQRWSE